MFCVFVCLVTGNGGRIGPSVKLYFMIYQQRMRFRVATLMINLLRCAMVLIGPNGKCSRVKCAEKWLIRNQLAVSAGSKQVVVFDMYHSSSKHKRAKIDIPLLILLLHSNKSLRQAALEVGVSESKLKNAVKEHGYDGWSDFKFNNKNDLSEKATHSPLTTSPHDFVGSNTSGHAIIYPSAAYLVNNTTSSSQPEMLMQQIPENGGTNHQFCFQPQNTTSPSEKNVILSARDAHEFSHVSDLDWLSSFLSEEANQSSLATNLHGGDISNTIGLADLNPSSDQYSNTFGFPVSNESNHHNLPMSLQASNVNQCSTLSSLMQQNQVYGGTNDQLGSQTRNQQPVTTPIPETGMPDRRPVTVLAAYRKKTFKFNLTSESTKQDLEKEVTKRVNLEVGSFYLDYKDEEGRWICIGCDEDLKNCMDFVRSSDKTTVEMLVQLND